MQISFQTRQSHIAIIIINLILVYIAGAGDFHVLRIGVIIIS